MKVVLVSVDEGGFQPLGLATALPFIKQHCCQVKACDASKENIDSDTDLIGFSVPNFGAIEETVKQAQQLRRKGYQGLLVFYNQYATVQPETFLLDENCCVVLGEYEETLSEIVECLLCNKSFYEVDFVYSIQNKTKMKQLKRKTFLIPDRLSLPALSLYAHKEGKLVGNIETMRGCAHGCTYCSVYAAYEKKVIKIPSEIILGDIAQVVSMGATHITFIDADFFSTGKRGFRIIEEMHKKHPFLTYDITLRLDDVIRYQTLFPDLKISGCVELTSAFEFPSSRVLEVMQKKITMEQIKEALGIIRKSGIKLVSTFITYNPWVDSDDLEYFEKYLTETGLVDQIDQLQLQTRLLLYKGSPLLNTTSTKQLKLTDRGTYYEWEHPDKRVDLRYQNLNIVDDNIRKRCCIKG